MAKTSVQKSSRNYMISEPYPYPESFFESGSKRRDYMSSGKDTVEILISGKLGVGKSSLVNGIIGTPVAEECDGPAAGTEEIKSYTSVQYVEEIHKTVTIKVWDTPGHGNPFADENISDKLLVRQMKQVDLVLYAMDMRGRLEKSAIDELRGLMELMGEDMWKHFMFVLTFANEVTPGPTAREKNKCKYFERNMESWTNLLRKALTDNLKVPSHIVEQIEIVPTGYGSKGGLPDRKDWFSPFWGCAFSNMKPEAQATLFAINTQRINHSEEFRQKTTKTWEMSIFTRVPFRRHKLSILEAAASDPQTPVTTTLGGGMVGGVTGVGIGAAVGVVGGPVGVIVGAVAGGAVGGVIGATVGGIIFTAIKANASVK